jgi:hypothetical protein
MNLHGIGVWGLAADGTDFGKEETVCFRVLPLSRIRAIRG